MASILIAAVAIGGYLYVRLDDEIRRYAENFLASHYPHLEVRLEAAQFHPGRGGTLRGLTLAERLPEGSTRRLIHIQELQILGKFDLDALLAGKPTVDRVVVVEPRVQAVRRQNGHWNLQSLFPLPPAGDQPITVEVVDAQLSMSDAAKPTTKPLVFNAIQLQIAGQPAPADAPHLRPYRVRGTWEDSLAKKFSLAGEFRRPDGLFQVTAQVEGLEVNTTLLRSMPGLNPAWLDRVALTATANLQLQAEGGGDSTPPLRWSANFQVANGRATLDGLPRQLTNISLTGIATQDQLALAEAHAKYGSSNLVLAANRQGWAATAPLALHAQVDRFLLDDHLRESLPGSLARLWNRFRPLGEVGAELKLRYDGDQWQPDLLVHCHDVAFEDHEKFPYRVQRGQGKLHLQDHGDPHGAQLAIALQAQAGNRPIAIQGALTGLPSVNHLARPTDSPPPPPLGWLEVQGQQLPITEPLMAALQVHPTAAKVVESLQPAGLISVRWYLHRSNHVDKPHTETDLTFHDCQVRFDKFPYPLSHINGHAIGRDGHWEFRDLVSREPSSGRQIECHGDCHQTAHEHLLSLHFQGTEIPLDDTLYLALNAEQQQAWAHLKPTGRINFQATVQHRFGDAQDHSQPDIDLVVESHAESVSILPTFFPYRFDKLSGQLAMQNQQVTFRNLQASHGQTKVATDGTWAPLPNGGWEFNLTKLHVDRLSANYDLIIASPAGLRKVFEQVAPQGNFAIHEGALRFTRQSANSPHLRSEWNIRLGCQQNDLQLGVSLEDVSGVLRLAGRHEGNQTFTAGELEIDSCFWQGVQVTNLRGPLWVNHEEVRLGRGATEQLQQPPRQVEADLYGGRLTLDAHVRQDPLARYTVAAQLKEADLNRFSVEYLGDSAGLTGKLDGELSLNGRGPSLDLLRGGGQVQVRNATMYELPVMARLLKVLRNRAPDKTAFTGIDTQFRLSGQTVHFDSLNLLGDAVSLYGKGMASFDRQLDLVFYSTVGRNDYSIPLLRSVVSQAGANLLLIKVTGPLAQPTVVREALPAVNSVLESLQASGGLVPTGLTPNSSRKR